MQGLTLQMANWTLLVSIVLLASISSCCAAEHSLAFASSIPSLGCSLRKQPKHCIFLKAAVEDVEKGNFKVTPVPTYMEMLEWAKGTDLAVERGEIPGIGMTDTEELEDGSFSEQRMRALSQQEKAQIAALNEILQKRARQQAALSPEGAHALRQAMKGVNKLINTDAATPPASTNATTGPQLAKDFTRNGIYGTRAARDQIYLYVWSLLQKKQGRGGELQ